MKSMKHLIVSAFVALYALAMPSTSNAQATFFNTTLSSAVSSTLPGVATSGTISVAAVPSGIAVGWEVYVDKEAMYITGINGLVLSVQRGYDGTSAVYGHNNGALTWIGPTSYFQQTVPAGACTASQQQALPFIVTQMGLLVSCSNGQWVASDTTPTQSQGPNARVQVAQSSLAAGGLIAASSTGYVIQPTDYIVALQTTGTGSGGTAVATNTIALPNPSLYPGRQVVIKDESGGITGTTYILIQGTVEGVASGTINGAAAGLKLNTQYAGVTLYAGSGGWQIVACTSGNLGCTIH